MPLIGLLFRWLIMSDSLWLHGLQHARLPCPSPSPRVCSDSCPLSWWCHPTILPSVVPFSSCLQSFPAPGSFPMSQVFASGGQSTEASASASVFSINIQDWFPLELTGVISCSSMDSQEFSPTPQFKSINSLALSLLYLENSAAATGLEKVSFHSNPKERQCQRMLKLLHNCTHLTC